MVLEFMSEFTGTVPSRETYNNFFVAYICIQILALFDF